MALLNKFKPNVPWRVWFASWQFRSQRARYYEYLAEALNTSPSHRTLLDLFAKDAQRHGPKRARGILTRWWLEQFPHTGGNLSETWRGTMPKHDRLIVHKAQASGHKALAACCQQLAVHLRVMQSATRTFLSISASGMVACLIGLAVCCIFPLFTLPHLLKAFSAVPIEYYGTATLRLMAWVDLIQSYGWISLFMVTIFFLGMIYSFSYVVHPWRYRLDSIGLWRIYRDVQSIRFFSATAMLLSAGLQRGMALREVLLEQHGDVNPWLQGHLQRMVYQMDIGVDPVEAINTGLIDKEAWWLFIDLVQARGLHEGLQQTCETIRSKIANDIEQRAWRWRWLLLSLSLACVMAIGYWHIVVIEALRQGLLMHYSTF